jgi:hypothetical protein
VSIDDDLPKMESSCTIQHNIIQYNITGHLHINGLRGIVANSYRSPTDKAHDCFGGDIPRR